MKNKKSLFAGFLFIAVVLFGIFVLVQPSLAESSSVSTAEQLYANGRFAESAQLYEQLIAQEQISSAIYYNLGNAYYQQGELGKAIVNYNRALELDPRDADTQANLALARAQTSDNFNVATEANIYTIFTTAVNDNLTLNQTAWFALAFWFLLAIAIIAIRQMEASKLRTYLKMGTAVLGIFFFIATFSFGSRLLEQNQVNTAVIVVPQVEVSNGPGDQFVNQFTLHNGAEVDLVETRGSWAKLALPGGETTGWIPTDAIEAVN